jgi:hypothetical protein
MKKKVKKENKKKDDGEVDEYAADLGEGTNVAGTTNDEGDEYAAEQGEGNVAGNYPTTLLRPHGRSRIFH